MRVNGHPISLDNIVVGGIQIRAGKYERDVTCSDPEHCLLAMRGGSNCATYFTDIHQNVYCPSVRGNTGISQSTLIYSTISSTLIIDYCLKLLFILKGGNFNYGRDPGWKKPGNPILNG